MYELATVLTFICCLIFYAIVSQACREILGVAYEEWLLLADIIFIIGFALACGMARNVDPGAKKE